MNNLHKSKIKPVLKKRRVGQFSPMGYEWICTIGRSFTFYFKSWDDAIHSRNPLDFKYRDQMTLEIK